MLFMRILEFFTCSYSLKRTGAKAKKLKNACELFIKEHPEHDPEPIVKAMIQRLEDIAKKYKNKCKDGYTIEFKHAVSSDSEKFAIIARSTKSNMERV